jgi:serine/threonine protein kinase
MNFNIVIIRHLHSGGYGDLFVAQRSDTGEQVVVKYLRDPHLTAARKAFAREVRILARNHPGLVRLLAWDLNAESPYYVMPYLGGSLKAYAGRLTSEELRAVAAELAAVLANLHAQAIFHGDVKPDNILVSWEGHIQVADPLGNGFGCTVLFSQNRGGTPGYWAPEVRGGAPIHAAGDVYSLGATLYELSTGRRPADDQNLDPGPWTEAKIREIIVACCNSNPGERPTMSEVIRLLGNERWENIQAQRRQRQGLVGACVLCGLAFLGICLLTKGSEAA